MDLPTAPAQTTNFFFCYIVICLPSFLLKMDSNDAIISASGGRRKRVLRVDEWKRNKYKVARLKGEKYVNHNGREIPAVDTSKPCGCKKKCTDSEDIKSNINDMLGNFRGLKSKDEQDSYLQQLIEAKSVRRHRPRNDGAPLRQHTFLYYLKLGDRRQEVCLKAFVALHGVTIQRVKRLRILLIEGKIPKDSRGKAPKRGNKLSGQVRGLIEEHIESYPEEEESHYAAKLMQYLDARLNMKLFKQLAVAKKA